MLFSSSSFRENSLLSEGGRREESSTLVPLQREELNTSSSFSLLSLSLALLFSLFLFLSLSLYVSVFSLSLSLPFSLSFSLSLSLSLSVYRSVSLSLSLSLSLFESLKTVFESLKLCLTTVSQDHVLSHHLNHLKTPS